MEKKFQLSKAFAEPWIQKLRDPETKQTTGTLVETNKYDEEGDQLVTAFCCLGVGGVVCGYTVENMMLRSFVYTNQKDREAFPNYPEELRYDDSGNKDTEDTLPRILSDMNDKGKTFAEIADWVEQNVEFV